MKPFKVPLAFLLLLGAALAGCGNSQNDEPVLLPRVDLEIPQVNVEVGEPLTARLIVLHPRRETPTPSFNPEDYGLTLIDSRREGPKPMPGSLDRSVYSYRLAAYVPGPVEIGPVRVDLPGRDKPLHSQRILVTILDPLDPATRIDLSSLLPEKGAVPVPSNYAVRLVVYVSLSVALALAAIALVLWLLIRRRSRRDEARPTPKDKALAALDALAEQIPAADNLQPVYYEMNLVLRRYIEECFGFLAAHQTTEEFLDAAGDRLPASLQAGLAGYLEHCDMVKYARLPAGRAEAERAVERAREFVIDAWRHVRHRFEGEGKPGSQPVREPVETAPVGSR